jgi:ribosomal protein S18 acetylase RimI-like enzyme
MSESEEEIVARGTRYRLVPLRGSGLAPLAPLLRPTFRRRDFTLDWLIRKYGGEFGAVGGFSYVALTDDGEAAAACGMLPWPIRFGDRVEIAAQVVDAATHADHRRRGLFTRLTELAHARCVAAGVSFFFAFPHRGGDSYPGFVGALGYTDIGLHNEYQRAIKTPWLERVARRAGASQLYQRYVDRVFADYAPAERTLRNSLVREGFAGTERDDAFFAYKSFAGSRVLQLDRGRVWLKIRHGIQVGDIDAESDADMDACVRSLERLATRLGVHRIVLHASHGTRTERFFANRYSRTPSVSVIHRNVSSEIPPERLRFTLGDLDNF